MAGKILGGASDKGISAEAQIGDRETDTDIGSKKATGDIRAEDNATVSVKNENSDTKVGKAGKVTVNQMPIWIVIFALIGWLLPTPSSIYRVIKSKWIALRSLK